MSTCLRPPRGWWCSRDSGHHGPCAAYPKSIAARLRTWWAFRR